MKKMTGIIIGALLICVLIVTITTVVSSAEEIKEKTGYIYIGDSRFVGMNKATALEYMSDTFVVAKSGMGYNWYMKDGSNEVYNIREEYEDIYTNWVYIFNLGVNDLNNIENYKNLYKELSNEATVYFLSINPTDDSVGGIQCKDIEEFNKSMRIVTGNDGYINSYDYLTNITGFTFDKRKDGMHYSDETYIDLFEFIKMSLEVHEFVKEHDDRYSAYYYLYNMK